MELMLKPCPFCGGDAEVLYIPPFVHPRTGTKGVERWQVVCTSCRVVTAGKLSQEAAEQAWNRRVNK